MLLLILNLRFSTRLQIPTCQVDDIIVKELLVFDYLKRREANVYYMP